MLSRKSSSKKIDEAVGHSVNFELTIADLAKRSERRAWTVTWCAVALALILAGGYYYMLPLKQKVPYLVMADAYTGTATVAKLDGDVALRGITTREAINRSNVAHFIIARESYDLALVDLRDWKTVQTMSAPAVKSAYTKMFSRDDPDGWFNKYGKDKAIRVRLLSIQLIGGGAGKTPRGATVRFQRSVYNKLNGGTRTLDNKIATMAFTYKQNLEMTDQNRIENPLGFWVTSYRVDADYATAPPAEIPAPPIAASPSTAAVSASTTNAVPASVTSIDSATGVAPQ